MRETPCRVHCVGRADACMIACPHDVVVPVVGRTGVMGGAVEWTPSSKLSSLLPTRDVDRSCEEAVSKAPAV